jgi:DNA-binding XRE family transcriptional regulator
MSQAAAFKAMLLPFHSRRAQSVDCHVDSRVCQLCNVGKFAHKIVREMLIIMGMSRSRCPTPLTIKCGKKIEFIRKKRGWDQAALAAHTGIERGHISKIENGKRLINLATLQKLANGLDTTMSMLLRGL